MEKSYDSKIIEEKIYRMWERSGYFNPDNLPGKRSKNFIVYMPLPNVTGSLHMGHLLNNTFQDIVVRYERLKGKKALYLPGTDHAGIATQYVVEKELKKRGLNRFDLGRDDFIKHVWEWKEKYGGLILDQLKKIGISADWSRSRFTMDSAYSKDVLSAFVHYYKKGWIYRGLRTVNWCTRCGTSLSDLELEYDDQKTKLYYIKYGPFVVATVRPETIFGDYAVAVNPKDDRYKKHIGRKIEIGFLSTEGEINLPSTTKREISVVAEKAVDPDFGSGALKITPAHDLTDFEIGKRHNLPLVQVIGKDGRLNEKTGKYAGMKTKEAREKILKDLKEIGLFEKEEDYDLRASKCYRCNNVIEPIPSRQWFLKMKLPKSLQKKSLTFIANEAVRSGKAKIYPPRFKKPYLDWLLNVRDWTVSRQIWWGHQLPVWFCQKSMEKDNTGIQGEDKFIVSIKKPKKCPFCKGCNMKQSPDVLDTWFSSALWPFAGLSKKDSEKYYPGNVLITARDILNLWVARMIFSGVEFMKKIPFSKVYIHGTILNKEGKRMSKSLGTGIDPLNYINEHGADATRFGIVWQATGQDIRWDEAAIFAGRKFANKIWNASRFVLGQIGELSFLAFRKVPSSKLHTQADKKILKELEVLKKEVDSLIDKFELSKALQKIYHFFWHKYCDVYIEESKNQIKDKRLEHQTKKVLVYVLLESLKLIHPFMPFVTEAVYQGTSLSRDKKKKEFLMVERLD